VACAFLILASCGKTDSTGPTPPPPGDPGAPTIPAGPVGALSGRVSDLTGQIEGAVVRVASGNATGRSTTTNAAGDYRLDDIPSGLVTVETRASGYADQRATIEIVESITTVRHFTLVRNGPRAQFSAGQWRVNVDIIPGRYFADPVASCYWERQAGLGGGSLDRIASGTTGFDSPQLIVDILASDLAFETNQACGRWVNAPRLGAQAGIPSGTWVVGTQIAPGTYVTSASANCYWERVRDFTHRGNVIASERVTIPGQRVVTILDSDVGFHSEPQCGTWTRTAMSATSIR
jgi:hypothetical protein